MERVVVEPPPKRQKTEVSPDPQPFAHGYQGPPTGDVVAEHARAATEDGGAQSKPVNRAASSSEQSGDVVNSPVPNHGAGGSSSSAKNDASFSIEVLRPGSGVSSGEHFSVYFGVSAEMFIFSYPVASKTLTARQLKDFLLGSGTVDTVWGEAGKPPHHQFVLLREREDGEEKTDKKSEDDVEEDEEVGLGPEARIENGGVYRTMIKWKVFDKAVHFADFDSVDCATWIFQREWEEHVWFKSAVAGGANWRWEDLLANIPIVGEGPIDADMFDDDNDEGRLIATRRERDELCVRHMCILMRTPDERWMDFLNRIDTDGKSLHTALFSHKREYLDDFDALFGGEPQVDYVFPFVNVARQLLQNPRYMTSAEDWMVPEFLRNYRYDNGDPCGISPVRAMIEARRWTLLKELLASADLRAKHFTTYAHLNGVSLWTPVHPGEKSWPWRQHSDGEKLPPPPWLLPGTFSSFLGTIVRIVPHDLAEALLQHPGLTGGAKMWSRPSRRSFRGKEHSFRGPDCSGQGRSGQEPASLMIPKAECEWLSLLHLAVGRIGGTASEDASPEYSVELVRILLQNSCLITKEDLNLGSDVPIFPPHPCLLNDERARRIRRAHRDYIASVAPPPIVDHLPPLPILLTTVLFGPSRYEATLAILQRKDLSRKHLNYYLPLGDEDPYEEPPADEDDEEQRSAKALVERLIAQTGDSLTNQLAPQFRTALSLGGCTALSLLVASQDAAAAPAVRAIADHPLLDGESLRRVDKGGRTVIDQLAAAEMVFADAAERAALVNGLQARAVRR